MLRHFRHLSVKVFGNIHFDLDRQKGKGKQQGFENHKDLAFNSSPAENRTHKEKDWFLLGGFYLCARYFSP